MPSATVTAMYGSPPRVWGNRSRCVRHTLRARFTPTCVGKSRASDVKIARSLRFTPTCVGKSTSHGRQRNFGIGSPPRVWGNLMGQAEYNTQAAVHPHVCGEIPGHDGMSKAASGSPPRVWGNRNCVVAARSRVIGSPPRVWGNHRTAGCTSSAATGSPPRVWGNRACRPVFSPSCPVHPHVCGEIECTRRPEAPAQFQSVHPHVCGEIPASATRAAVPFTGSPPRVWGNRARRSDLAIDTGSPPRVWGNR